MSARGIAEAIHTYCCDLPAGAPVDPFSKTLLPSGTASALALVVLGHRYSPDPAYESAKANIARATGTVPRSLRWMGEVLVDAGASECVGVTGLHETTYDVQVHLMHEAEQQRTAEYWVPAGMLDLTDLLDYLRVRFLSAPTLIGAVNGCVAPNGVAEVEIGDNIEALGCWWHQGWLRFQVVERELLTLAWS